jgi:hypothetical protein
VYRLWDALRRAAGDGGCGRVHRLPQVQLREHAPHDLAVLGGGRRGGDRGGGFIVWLLHAFGFVRDLWRQVVALDRADINQRAAADTGCGSFAFPVYTSTAPRELSSHSRMASRISARTSGSGMSSTDSKLCGPT